MTVGYAEFTDGMVAIQGMIGGLVTDGTVPLTTHYLSAATS